MKILVFFFLPSSTSGLFFRTLAELSLSFLIKIVSTGRRNRRLSTKLVAGIVMLFTSAKLKEDYMTEKLSTSKLSQIFSTADIPTSNSPWNLKRIERSHS